VDNKEDDDEDEDEEAVALAEEDVEETDGTKDGEEETGDCR
jgi:hypothetical protein